MDGNTIDRRLIGRCVHEDPSAVFKGWKENPVEFDSVLNRSRVSYCWGSPDIIDMFSRGAVPGRVHTDAYASGDEIFAQSANTSLLDVWVFDRVRQFLAAESTKRNVLSSTKLILFLHLLGLDTAGHVHKPYSELFTENLLTVDQGIASIVELMEQSTGYDGRTAYVFTSDHGMTDKGSHGSGDPFETETPFLAWGAGLRHWNGTRIEAVDLRPNIVSFLELDGNSIPVHQINQADVAPVMSAILGIAVPKNNLGTLPHHLLNVSEEYAAWAMSNNAEQLLEQYHHWQREAERKTLQWLAPTEQKNFKTMIENFVGQIESSTEANEFVKVQKLCHMLMHLSLEAIRYFQRYHQPELLVALTLTMLGWLLLLAKETFTTPAQRTPPVTLLYFLVPIALWGYIGAHWREYTFLGGLKTVIYCIGFVIVVETLVLAFMDRRLLAPMLCLHCVLVVVCLYRVKQTGTKFPWPLFWRWFICNTLLAGFPLIPNVGRDNSNVYLLILSIIAWTVTNIVILKRGTLSAFLTMANILLQLLQAANLLYIISAIESSQSVPQWSRTCCWVFSALGLVTPLLASTTIADRMLALFSGLSAPYTMLSLSYEPLFLLCFCLTLYSWIEVESFLVHGKVKNFSFCSSKTPRAPVDVQQTRRSLAFMLFLLTSFFGTGNLATVSSFDPNWVRCFVTTFSPFTMMALIVLKLLVPLVLVVCSLKAMVIVTAVEKRKIFTLTLIVCDWMCLNFFFLVRNEGSWLEIGTSISHFVIIECTTIVVMMLYELARVVSECSLIERKRGPQYLPLSNKVRTE
ncbi:GPI ethanolamine phosphate transferase 1-like [Anopheles cruzii]|uniref:GPI ethanolamine phosphate transferase 1-like n=1 Tax=Anopheles cruzii TaxID=68878 RepID=UPI0022EC44AA|nr:GPI ethanolamine phosphate transferase 1-like [Anopheles cruzii]